MSPKKKEGSAAATRLQRLGRMILHNLPYKLLSLVLAVVLWAGLIAQDPTLTRSRTFNDVTVSVTGMDALKRSGYIVTTDLSSMLSGFTLRASVPQLQYNNVSVSSYNPRIELSRVTGEGEQELRVVTTSTASVGSVLEINPPTITVDVEKYITRYRIPVSVVTQGSISPGYWSSSLTLETPVVAVSGPQSLVQSIVRAEGVLNLSSLPEIEGKVRTAVTLQLIDANGQPIDSSLLQITNESVLIDAVVVEQTIYRTHELDISAAALVKGTPAEGYAVRSVRVSPSSAMVAGTQESLDTLNNLFTTDVVNVDGLSASVETTLRLRKPSELKYISTDSVTVTVEIGPVIGERSFSDVDITVIGLSGGLTAVEPSEKVYVTLAGPVNWLNSLTADDIVLTADVSGLAPGIWSIPLTLSGLSFPQESAQYLAPERIVVNIQGTEGVQIFAEES